MLITSQLLSIELHHLSGTDFLMEKQKKTFYTSQDLAIQPGISFHPFINQGGMF